MILVGEQPMRELAGVLALIQVTRYRCGVIHFVFSFSFFSNAQADSLPPTILYPFLPIIRHSRAGGNQLAKVMVVVRLPTCLACLFP